MTLSTPAVAAPAEIGNLRGPAVAWIAVVGDAGAADAGRESFPVARVVVAAPDGGRGLTLLGLAAAPLPQSAVHAGCGVVFEGALDNRAALVAELGDGLSPAASNAEIVARACSRWGDAAPERLRGSFALVAWDVRAQRLLAARDRAGNYPLFWTETGRETVLATSIDLLRGHPRVSREFHRAVLAELLCLRVFDARETPYAAIRRVPPAHRLIRDAAGERIEPSWRPEGIAALAGSLDDHFEEFDRLFERAVARCLEAGSPGILLSGGLDSVSVAAVAAAQCRALGLRPPLALSLVFPDAEANEEPVQRSVAAQLGLELCLRGFRDVGGGDRILAAAAAASRTYPVPALTPWRAAYLGLMRAAGEDLRSTVLTGHGGDEWLGVSIYLAADHLQRGELGALWRLWKLRHRSFNASAALTSYFVLWKFGLRPVAAAATVRALGGAAGPVVRWRKRRHARATTPSWVAPDPELRRELDQRAERYLDEPPLGDFYRRAVRESIGHPLVALEREEIFETGRQLGVAFASPFLDDELVEFLLRVPPTSLNADGRTKGLVRRSLAKRFPELGFERQVKIAATGFLRTFIPQEAGEDWAGLGGLQSMAELGLVDARGANDYRMWILQQGPTREAARLWLTMSLESWIRAH